MTGKRAVYVQVLGLTDEESRAFWPVHDEYEAKVKKVDDRLIRPVAWQRWSVTSSPCSLARSLS